MIKIYKIIKYMVNMNKFFFKEGLDYVRVKGVICRKDAAYAPFAYCRFMAFSFQDALCSYK